MDVASRKKQGVERQTTFGPSAPIDEWELEKATLLRELKQTKEQASRLQQSLDEQQATFERNRASLLKEVKLKEEAWEKRRQEADQQWMNETMELQKQLERQEIEHQEAIKDGRQQMEHALKMEQQKNERRIAHLHERLAAKERTLQELLDQQPLHEEQPSDENDDKKAENSSSVSGSEISSPLTPQTPSERMLHRHTSTTVATEDGQAAIKRLRHQLEQQQQQYQQLMHRYEEEHRLAANGHDGVDIEKQLQTVKTQHLQELDRLRDTFMKEHQNMIIHWEARMHNLQNEHEDAMRQLHDQYTAEKEVWLIDHQAKMDQLKHELQDQFNKERFDADHAWESKLQDIRSTLNEDSRAVQAHWEAKIDELTKAHEQALERANGKLDVVKSRLSNDIDRRHRVQDDLKSIQAKYNREAQQWQQEKHAMQCKLTKNKGKLKAMLDYETAMPLARDLVAILAVDDPNDTLPASSLADLLKFAKKRTIILQAGQLDRVDSSANDLFVMDFAY
ncbi:hypothetical protein BC940DRAFT_289983 [Gongronella butleri]|nr:hypothetical protein BC940DRAFT_289983 [Gongronella butleri]